MAGLFAQGSTLPDGQPRTETTVAACTAAAAPPTTGDTSVSTCGHAESGALLFADLRTLP